MKTAIVCDWIGKVGGAEKLLKEVINFFPAPIFTLFAEENPFSCSIGQINTSFLQKLPLRKKLYFPFFPFAINRFDLSNRDLILSFSHCVAKSIKPKKNQLHICYCHTPMRYIWDLEEIYLEDFPYFFKKLAKIFFYFLRKWDKKTANRVHIFIANSHYIADRIKRCYQREAKVIYPPVRTDFFTLEANKDNYYLCASRLVKYKKIDLIVKAFAKMKDRKLIVIGDGPEEKKLKKIATSNIQIIHKQSDDDLKKYLQKAKAFIFASIEDFGILPIEAQSCGTPVIALGKGGALETVIENKTGLFFQKQSDLDIMQVVERFEKVEKSFDPNFIRKHAMKFSEKRFAKEFKDFVQMHYTHFSQKQR